MTSYYWCSASLYENCRAIYQRVIVVLVGDEVGGGDVAAVGVLDVAVEQLLVEVVVGVGSQGVVERQEDQLQRRNYSQLAKLFALEVLN
jgi:hypothetical protein